jgi:uncharacterized membrane protein
MFERHGSFVDIVIGLLPLLLFAAAIGVGVWAVLRLTAGRGQPAVAAAGVTAVPRVDPAVEELRIRYARGEVTRDEFLTRGRDLGAVLDDEAPPVPPGPPATDGGD